MGLMGPTALTMRTMDAGLVGIRDCFIPWLASAPVGTAQPRVAAAVLPDARKTGIDR